MAVFAVAACGSAYVMGFNETPEVSENEIALGYEQPCYLSQDKWTCNMENKGIMCECDLNYVG